MAQLWCLVKRTISKRWEILANLNLSLWLNKSKESEIFLRLVTNRFTNQDRNSSIKAKATNMFKTIWYLRTKTTKLIQQTSTLLSLNQSRLSVLTTEETSLPTAACTMNWFVKSAATWVTTVTTTTKYSCLRQPPKTSCRILTSGQVT
jgi:hypothetical protein